MERTCESISSEDVCLRMSFQVDASVSVDQEQQLTQVCTAVQTLLEPVEHMNVTAAGGVTVQTS